MVRYNYKDLLEKDSNFKRWYGNIRRGSPSSADAKLRRIGYVCRVFNFTTKQLAAMTPKEGFELIDDVITKLENEGKQGEYMKDYVKALKSWFGHNGTQITQKIKVPANDGNTKVAQEQSPTPDQFRSVLNAADLKQKLEAVGIGLAGLRIETLGDYEGKDGLKVRDLPEIKIDDHTKTVEFAKIPTLILVRSNLSKAGHQYVTFLPEEGCVYLKELLEFRMRKGEKLAQNSPIIVSLRYHDLLENRHIRTGNISDSIRAPIRKAGYDWRPYILRTYFDTRMMMAEADGLILRDWRVFWMGHKGDIEHRYTLNKGRLPEDLVEKMRAAFAKAAEKYLVTTTNRNVTIDTIKAQFNKQFLEIAGYGTEEIDKLGDLAELSPTEINKLIQDKSRLALGLNGNSQKVVPMQQVKQYIENGWEYVKDLTVDEAIVKLPLS